MHLSTRRRALIASAIAAPFLGQARAVTQYKFGYPLPLDSQFGAGASVFVRELTRLTGGRLSVQSFPGSVLGAEREMIEAVQLGTQDLALVSTGAIGNFVPEVAIFDLPFLFRDYAHAHAALDGEIGAQVLARFAAHGLHALAWGEGGFRHISNTKRPVYSPEDLRGLKIRTQENPIHIAAFRGLGASPTPINWAETFIALQQGVVDGQDNPISVIVAAKLYQVQKYLSLTQHLYSPAVFLASPAFYDTLSPADQSALRAAARMGAQAMRQRVARDDRSGVAYLRQRGMAVVEQIDKTTFIAALATSYQDFRQRFGAARIERIQKA